MFENRALRAMGVFGSKQEEVTGGRGAVANYCIICIYHQLLS